MNEAKYLNIIYTDLVSRIKYNGKECNTTDHQFPLSTPYDDENVTVSFTIEIATGRVLRWRNGDTARIYSKPVDEGVYTFTNIGCRVVKQIADYVIDGLDIDDDGYGDYIFLTIQPDGTIKNWDAEKILSNLKD